MVRGYGPGGEDHEFNPRSGNFFLYIGLLRLVQCRCFGPDPNNENLKYVFFIIITKNSNTNVAIDNVHITWDNVCEANNLNSK